MRNKTDDEDLLFVRRRKLKAIAFDMEGSVRLT